jgi:RNA polymerase sigma factor (sigma-70 family)
MKGALRMYWRAGFGNRARKQLTAAVEKLSLYCRAPDLQAKGATDLDEAMKQFTWWPQSDLLYQIKDSVLTLASTERKNPSRRIWRAFELVDTRMPKPQLLKHINELVERAIERFTEANFSDLEALVWERREGKEAQDLLRDIDRIEENVGAARALDWAQYRDILTRFSDDGRLAHANGDDIALACYARVLELIVDHRRWEKLRKQSEALVFWLLEIGYPKAGELEAFNRRAAFRWIFEEEERFRRKREAAWDKYRPSKKIIRSKEDAEDVRLMVLVGAGNADSLAELRKRHEGRVKWVVEGITGSNSAVDDIAQRVFTQVWKAAPTYVPTAAKFTTWLTEIAKNLALNEKKRAKKEKERVEFAHMGEDDGIEVNATPGISGGDSEQAALQQSLAGQDAEPLLQALNQLSPLERRIIEALNGYGRERKTRREVADELGISPGEVEDLEDEALGRMRQSMSL